VKKGENIVQEWVHIMNNDFDTTYLSILSNQFIVVFNKEWLMKNKEKIEADEKYRDIFMSNSKNIIGGDRINEDTRNQRVRQTLFRLLKRTIKTVIEYDVV
jgi:hypothetical protein